MKKIFIFLCSACMLIAIHSSAKSPKEVTLADFMDKAQGNNITLALQEALAYCKKVKAGKLIIPKGKYAISPDYASERYVWASNNDEGLKRFAFDLTSLQNFEIDGQGSELLFHGFVCPFLLDRSKHITIRDMSIDYARTFHSEGQIVALQKDVIDIQFAEAFPYKIENGLLYFYDNNGKRYPYNNLLEFDPIKRETAFMAKDYWLSVPLQVQDLGNRTVRIQKEGITGVVGNTMVFGAANRLIPCFTITGSEDILIQKVNIYHCGGMGVIAQRSRNLELNEVKVTPAPASGRVISITADATHFVNCSGYIRMLNCLFEMQKDDATNIHGIYAAIDQIISPTEIIVKYMHSQQQGFELAKAGEKVEIVEQKSLVSLGENVIKTIKPLNKEYTRIEFEKSLPANIKLKDVIARNVDYPEVLIKGCTMRGNRARGLLLGSRAKTVIEENYFHIPGAAILFEGDGNYWYEQSGVRDVLIRNNVFDNCNFGVWGNALFQVGSGIYENRAQSRYNRNIVIENNTIKAFDPRLVNIYSVDGFTFRNNKIEKTTDYPLLYKDAVPFVVKDSDHVDIKE